MENLKELKKQTIKKFYKGIGGRIKNENYTKKFL